MKSGNLKKINSIPDVFKINTPVLSVINKDYGPEFLRTFLSNWISDINFFCGGQMNVEQCEVSADLIYEDFYFFTVADLKLISKRLKKRKFIRISGNEIYTEIESYFNDRCKYAQEFSKKESDRNKNNFDISELNNDELKTLYKDVSLGKELSKPVKKAKRCSDRELEKHKKAALYYEQYRKDNPNETSL